MTSPLGQNLKKLIERGTRFSICSNASPVQLPSFIPLWRRCIARQKPSLTIRRFLNQVFILISKVRLGDI